jgi:dTDP-4-dehydrorhamnose reductase
MDPPPVGSTTKEIETSGKLRVLVTGASGYLGQHLLHSMLLEPQSSNTSINSSSSNLPNLDVTAAYGSLETFPQDCKSIPSLTLVPQTQLDLSNDSSIQQFIECHLPFHVVIHMAAMSSPYACEKDPQRARIMNCPTTLLNAIQSKNQSKEATTMMDNDNQQKTLFIFLSTDQVYDGFNAPYEETDSTKPLNEYGNTKLAFEQELLNLLHLQSQNTIQPIILRSSLILGGVTPLGSCRKQSFLQFVHDRLTNQQDTDFYTNEYRNVVSVRDIIKVMSFFIHRYTTTIKEQDQQQQQVEDDVIFNLGGKDRVSRYEIAQMVAKVTNLDDQYAKATERAPPPPPSSSTADPDVVVVRSPPDISMNISKLERVTCIQMSGLKEIVESTFC